MQPYDCRLFNKETTVVFTNYLAVGGEGLPIEDEEYLARLYKQNTGNMRLAQLRKQRCEQDFL